jgi:two-component system, LytTR family, sensor kinase
MFLFDLKEKSTSFWFLQIVGWLFYWLMVCITLLSVLPADGSVFDLFRYKLVRAVLGLLLSSAMHLIYKRFVKPQNFNAAVWISIICSVVFSFIWAYLLIIFYWSINEGFDLSASYARLPENVLNYSITLLAWSALYFGIKFWREWQREWQRERENALQSAALANKAQLETLRYQLNPHFLFNALNSIRASVKEDGNRARQMITQLSYFLRHSLVGVEKKAIPLREELEAARNYLAIEKIRFEENLEVEFETDEKSEEFLVPCFLLNPLVENAVKHGLPVNSEPLKIKISARLEGASLILEVANTGKLNELQNLNGTKIGLKNVRERLEKLFGEKSRFELTQDGEFVVARIEISKPARLSE